MNFNKKNTLIIFDKYLKKNNINNYCIPKFYELKTSNNVFFDFDLNYPLILRSSVNKEDGIFSYSWIFESYYPIDSKEEILKYYKKIMDYNNDNFLFYKKINKIKQDNYIMKPILQEFIIWEYSFVVNTNFKNKYIRIESSPWINKNITDWGKELFILLINKDTLSISIESFIKNNVFYTIEDNKLCSKNFNTCNKIITLTS